MAEETDKPSGQTLSQMFDMGLKLHSEIDESSEPSNSDKYQHKVKKAILLLEDATRLVSMLDIFSKNETVSEVPTEHLKYFLLPVLLGDLNSKVVGQERLEIIKIVETYYLDYLRRIRDYEVYNIRIPDVTEDDEDEEADGASAVGGPPKRPDLAKMNREREEKIRQYKERKEIEASLKELKIAVENPSHDEDVVREYYLKMIRKFVFAAQDELNSISTEKGILRHMAKIRGNPGMAEAAAAVKRPPTRPLKPIIITKDAMQKEVFGMGYKNLPVMSIEEFYEQRVRDGWFPDPKQQQTRKPDPNSLQDRAANEELAQQHEDEEGRVKDEKEDRDDAEELARQREFDEYKDDHKRGEGNRHNRG